MNRRIRFFAAVLAGCTVLAPAALGDGAAGPLPPASKSASTPSPKPAPLKPGKSAGIRGAQQGQTGLALVGAGGAIIALIAVTAGSGGGNGAAQPNNAQVVPATTS